MPTGQTPTPQYERGTSLAYGAASAANRQSQDVEFKPATPEDEFLFADATDRPAEPITQGAPFGPGVNATRFAQESPDEFLGRVVQQMTTTTGTPEVQKFARRIAERAARGL
jgi:hypothetical protein